MNDADFFAAPAFKADEALARLRRELRDAGLTEREGRFERQGQAWARAALTADGQSLAVAVVKKPSRQSPEWLSRTVRDSAQVRDFVADVKKRLASTADRDD